MVQLKTCKLNGIYSFFRVIRSLTNEIITASQSRSLPQENNLSQNDTNTTSYFNLKNSLYKHIKATEMKIYSNKTQTRKQMLKSVTLKRSERIEGVMSLYLGASERSLS